MSRDKSRKPLGSVFPSDLGKKASIQSLLKSAISLNSSQSSASTDIRFALVDLPLDTKAAQKILPRSLKLCAPPKARLFVASYGQAVYSPSYNEAALLLEVKTLFGKGGTVCWMVVDQDAALIYGRNVLACPKKLAEFDIEDTGNNFRATVTRRGVPLISLEAQKGKAESSPEPVFSDRAFNPGGPGQLGLINLIWSFRLKECIYESYSAEGNLTIAPSPFDPISELVGQYSNPLPMRLVKLDLVGSSIPIPTGFAGLSWFLNAYNLRFR